MADLEASIWISPELASKFGLLLDISAPLIKLTGGLQHEVWKATTNTGDVVFKRQTVEPSSLAIELEEAASLGSVACANLIHTIDQRAFIHQAENSEDYFIRAYSYIQGRVLSREPITEDLAHSIGKQLALLHNCSRQALQNQLQEALNEPVVNYYDIKQLPQTIKAQCRPFTTGFDISRRPAIIGHRDVSGKNVIIAAATGMPYFIDFDEAGLTTVDGEILDAAFNLAGVHTIGGPSKEIVKAFICGYRSTSTENVKFDINSFHMLIGMSEYWWLGVCLNRLKDGRTSVDNLEGKEVARLMSQLPRDLELLPTWVKWLN